MKTAQDIISSFPSTIDDLLRHPRWDGWIHDRLGNHLFLSNPERAERIAKYAETGSEGSTHAEVIGDWFDFAAEIARECSSEMYACDAKDEDWDKLDEQIESLHAALHACEDRHAKSGTLHEVIG